LQNRLVHRLLNRDVEGSSFDPSALNDSIATETEWSPLSPPALNFYPSKLVTIGETRVEFQSTWIYKLLYGFCMMVGVLTMAVFFDGNYPLSIREVSLEDSLLLMMGFILVGLGFCLRHFSMQVIVFDKHEYSFWKGHARSGASFNPESFEIHCTLKDIHALQIISELRSGSKGGPYHSYELNIVLTDGQRINVVNHGDKTRIEADANILSKFLDVPLWSTI